MNRSRMASRTVRLISIYALLIGLMLAAMPPVIAVGAADTLDPTHTPGAGDPRLPNHRAEQEYFDSLRVAPPGVSPGLARAVAQRQADALPEASSLPAAIGGKGPPVRDALAPPSAVWQPLGPKPLTTSTFNNSDYHFTNTVAGRTTAIVVGPNTGVIYIGTAGGGVWKSVNDGATWTPLTDKQQTLSTGSLALDITDGTDNTIFVGTGEFHNSSDSYRGVGVLKSTNGGATWTLVGTGLPNFGVYNASSVFIGAMAANGSTIFAGTSAGLYRSTDSGTTWSLMTVAAGNTTAPVTDLTVDGTNVYAVLSRTTNALTGAGIYKSTTGGASGSFTQQTTTLPAASTWGRSQLAIARGTPNTLYLAISTGTNVTNGGNLLGIYKTTDGGANWAVTAISPSTLNYMNGSFTTSSAGQGWYDNSIAVDPANANLVYAGGVHVVVSTDGGATWAKVVDVYCNFTSPCNASIHPDQHGFAFGISGTPRPLYVGNDGGVFKTANGNLGTSATWSGLNATLNITQFYGGGTTPNYTTNSIVAGGTQDNGTSRSTATTAGTWNGLLGGDGSYIGLDPASPDMTMYASYPNGTLKRTTNANAGSSIVWSDRYPPTQCTSTLFVNPFLMDPTDGNHLLYSGYGVACQSVDGGANWTQSAVQSGFYTRAFAIAPTDSAVIYAGVNGAAYRATNGNTTSAATYSACGSGLPATPFTWLAVDPADATIAYATYGGFGIGHVFKSTNCGAWSNITGTLPDIPTTSIVAYPISGGTALVIGTDVGVFVSTNNGTTWSKLTNGLPNTIIGQVFKDGASSTLFVATHGRGMWRMPIPADTNPAPTVASISPATGPSVGGTAVTINGTGFLAGASVSFDGVAATNVVVVNSTKITATTPAHQDGTADVVVVNSDNRGGTLAGSYTFGVLNPLPGGKPGTGTGSPNPLPNARSGTSTGNPNPLPNPRP